MPRELKELAAEKIETYGRKMEREYSIPYHGWQSIIDFMFSADNSHLMDNFKSKIAMLDKIRNKDFYKINPEFFDV